MVSFGRSGEVDVDRGGGVFLDFLYTVKKETLD